MEEPLPNYMVLIDGSAREPHKVIAEIEHGLELERADHNAGILQWFHNTFKNIQISLGQAGLSVFSSNQLTLIYNGMLFDIDVEYENLVKIVEWFDIECLSTTQQTRMQRRKKMKYEENFQEVMKLLWTKQYTMAILS